MCGIAGIYHFDNRPPEAVQMVKTMAAAIAHRGTDDEGFFENEHLVLAHQRLSIIDLETGHQPMSNEDGSVVVACNGEIYNFKEIREDLEKKGHMFSTNTDTEVLVHGYEEYGHDILQKLNGMFAFVIWNSNKKELFIARDRLGIKPLYYYLR